MQALVGGMPMVGVRPFANSTDVANDDRLHPLLVQGGDKVGGELVQRIFQLIRYFLQTSLFRLDTPASAL